MKMFRQLLPLVLVIISAKLSRNEVPEYFWREYINGTVPPDAIAVGKRADGRNFYVGQIPIDNYGLMVVPICHGVKEVVLVQSNVLDRDDNSEVTVTTIDRPIKILCGYSETLYWLRANGNNLNGTIADKHAVIGGYAMGKGYLNVGRITFEGRTLIGRITTFEKIPKFYFVDDYGRQVSRSTYEVLIYDPTKAIDVRIKSYK